MWVESPQSLINARLVVDKTGLKVHVTVIPRLVVNELQRITFECTIIGFGFNGMGSSRPSTPSLNVAIAGGCNRQFKTPVTVSISFSLMAPIVYFGLLLRDNSLYIYLSICVCLCLSACLYICLPVSFTFSLSRGFLTWGPWSIMNTMMLN